MRVGRLIQEPALKLEVVFGAEPDLLVLHATLFGTAIPRWVLLDKLDWRGRHVEHALLSSPDREQEHKEHKAP